jgi:hypothetical protein
MATNNEDSKDLEIDVDPIEHMKARIKRQQRMLFGALGIASISLISAVVALVLALAKAPDSTETLDQLVSTAAQLQTEDEAFSAQIEGILASSRETQTQLQAISTQLGQLDVNDQRNVIIRVQRILIRQEQDYRNFLTTLENGMYNFHMMVPHSRGWWDDYEKELLETAELSKARENYVVNLRNN